MKARGIKLFFLVFCAEADLTSRLALPYCLPSATLMRGVKKQGRQEGYQKESSSITLHDDQRSAGTLTAAIRFLILAAVSLLPPSIPTRPAFAYRTVTAHCSPLALCTSSLPVLPLSTLSCPTARVLRVPVSLSSSFLASAGCYLSPAILSSLTPCLLHSASSRLCQLLSSA